MKKFKKIGAIVAVVLLVSLYLITLISAFIASPNSHALFLASLYSTIIIPIFLYAMILVYRLLKNKSKEMNSDSDIEENTTTISSKTTSNNK